MYSRIANAAFPALGFPNRTSPDQRLLGTSPRLNAPCDVLHRHVLSSHPPYALKMLYPHLQWLLQVVADDSRIFNCKDRLTLGAREEPRGSSLYPNAWRKKRSICDRRRRSQGTRQDIVPAPRVHF